MSFKFLTKSDIWDIILIWVESLDQIFWIFNWIKKNKKSNRLENLEKYKKDENMQKLG